MRYKRFEISNFKGIDKLTIDLEERVAGRIHTLVGLNESGKTTVLEAIDYFSRGGEDEGLRSVSRTIRSEENDLVPIARRANFNGNVTIKAIIALDDRDRQEMSKFLRTEYKLQSVEQAQQIEITDTYRFENSVFAERTSYWTARLAEVKASNERKYRALTKNNHPEAFKGLIRYVRDQLPEIWYFPNALFDFPDRIYLSPQQGETATAKFYRGLLEDILKSVDQTASIEEHLLRRFVSEEPAQLRAMRGLVLKMSRLLTSEVFDHWREILGRDDGMSVDLTVEAETAAGSGSQIPYVDIKIVGSDGYYSVNERSLGFRWFFVFLLLTTFRGLRNQASTEILFLFDEPASNLHSTAQSQLLKSLEKLSEKSRVIYTTHSHHLINPDWLEHTFVVRNRAVNPNSTNLTASPGQTDVQLERYRSFVSSNPDQTQYFQPVLDVLKYQPSRLELVPRIVLVEGKNDFYSLRLAQLAVSVHDPHFYPGGGAGSLDGVIALYLAWGRNFLVLLDSDREGKIQQERYLKRFGKLVEHRIVTLAVFDDNLHGSAMESVFSDADSEAIVESAGLQRTASKKTSKKDLNRAIQELVLTRQLPEFDADTIERLRSILTGLISRLDLLEEV